VAVASVEMVPGKKRSSTELLFCWSFLFGYSNNILISLTACKTPSSKVGDQQAVKIKERGHTSLWSMALGSEECPQHKVRSKDSVGEKPLSNPRLTYIVNAK